MRPSRQEQLAKVDHLASLWERLVNLHLNEEVFEDISTARENEFLSLQASIMQELAAVAEFEEGRFALVDEVTSVVNEAGSLRNLKTQSDFQVRRRKERGRQVADLIAKLRTLVAERDTTVRRQEKELETRLSRPFWDPEKGKFTTILTRVITSPVRFFSAIRVAGEAKTANTFLLTLLSLLMIGCVIMVVAFNTTTATAISYNFTLETGILSNKDTLVAKIAIWLFVIIGVVMVSLAAAIVAAILAHLFAILAHVSFKIVGAKKDMAASHKVVAFGLSPLLLLILLPIVAHFVKMAGLPGILLGAIPAVVLLYAVVLHVIGVHKVHSTSVGAGILGSLIAIILFSAVIFAALYVWHASVGAVPPMSGKYVYVTAEETGLWSRREQVRTLHKGEVLEFVEESENYYSVRSGKSEGSVKKADAEVRHGSLLSLPVFLLESSVARAEALIDQLSREIQKGASSPS
jgi:hypothetical protein